jgi:hypothetical protein
VYAAAAAAEAEAALAGKSKPRAAALAAVAAAAAAQQAGRPVETAETDAAAAAASVLDRWSAAAGIAMGAADRAEAVAAATAEAVGHLIDVGDGLLTDYRVQVSVPPDAWDLDPQSGSPSAAATLARLRARAESSGFEAALVVLCAEVTAFALCGYAVAADLENGVALVPADAPSLFVVVSRPADDA